MNSNLIAHASIDIEAPISRIWRALTDPKQIKQYMFGADVTSTFRPGDPITWSGEWKGQPYEDKGTVVDVIPGKRLEYTHFSPLTGEPDVPESYHDVKIELEPHGDKVTVSLSQDKNADETARAHSETNWRQMLEGLQRVVTAPAR